MTNEQIVTCDGTRLRYRIAGDGPPLVVQPPGWGFGVAFYEQTYAPLEAHATVIYYDTRGSGGSERDVDPSTINVGQFVDDLDDLRAHLGLEQFALTGHSHGGYIALNYALAHPDRLTHLITVDAQIGVTEPGEDMQRTIPQLAEQPEYVDAIDAFAGAWDFTSDAELGERFHQILPLYFHDVRNAASMRASVTASPPALAAMLAANASDGDYLVRDRLEDIVTPTLVIVGRHDFICSPVQAEVLRAGIPNAQLHVFEHSGHFPWIEEPDAFFTTVRTFLNDSQSARAWTR